MSPPLYASRRSPFLRSLGLLHAGTLLLGKAPLIAANPPRWEAQYTRIYTEGTAVGPGSGLLLGGNASIVIDPALMIGGAPSIRLDGGANSPANISTDPAVWPLGPNTTYVVELQYRVVANPGNNPSTRPRASMAVTFSRVEYSRACPSSIRIGEP